MIYRLKSFQKMLRKGSRVSKTSCHVIKYFSSFMHWQRLFKCYSLTHSIHNGFFFYLGVKTWRKEFCNWFFPLWNKHIYLIILINLITEILFQYRDVSSFLFYFKWKPVRACYFSSFFLLYHKSTAEVFHCVWACVVDVINLHPPLHDDLRK